MTLALRPLACGTTNFRLLAMHVVPRASVLLAHGGTNRWDQANSWLDNRAPIAGETAFFTGTLGSGGTIKLTENLTFTANVGTILINSPPTQYTDVNADTGSSAVGTINFGTVASGITYSFAGSGTADSARQLYIGGNRASTGAITTTIGNTLTLKEHSGLRLNLFSTLTGSGSIPLLSTGTDLVSGFHAGPELPTPAS